MKRGIQILVVYVLIFALIGGFVFWQGTQDPDQDKEKADVGTFKDILTSITDSVKASFSGMKDSLKDEKIIDEDKILAMLPKSCDLEDKFACSNSFQYFPESKSFVIRVHYLSDSPRYLVKAELNDGIECSSDLKNKEISYEEFFIEFFNCTINRNFGDFNIYYMKNKDDADFIHKAKGRITLG